MGEEWIRVCNLRKHHRLHNYNHCIPYSSFSPHHPSAQTVQDKQRYPLPLCSSTPRPHPFPLPLPTPAPPLRAVPERVLVAQLRRPGPL